MISICFVLSFTFTSVSSLEMDRKVVSVCESQCSSLMSVSQVGEARCRAQIYKPFLLPCKGWTALVGERWECAALAGE